ncbi:MAG: hypothetical protein PHF37_04480 [Phycisphaerae bacterium]|nr:hypothetical protein [Phycisphaerae bacterium]
MKNELKYFAENKIRRYSRIRIYEAVFSVKGKTDGAENTKNAEK